MRITHGILIGLVLASVSSAQTLDLLVGDRGVNRVIMRYDGTTGAANGTFADSTSGINSVRGMTLGPDGNIYVSSSSTNEIIRFNAVTGAKIDVFVSAGSGSLSGPDGLTFSPYDGNLYVSSRNNSSIKRYDATTGAYIDDFVASGAGGLVSPRGLVFGKDCWNGAPPPNNCNDGVRDLLVCSYGTPSVKRYDGATGAYMDEYLYSGNTMYSGGIDIGNPVDIILDAGPIGPAALYLSVLKPGPVGEVWRVSADEPQAWAYVLTSGATMQSVYGMGWSPDVTGDLKPELVVADGAGNKVRKFNGSSGVFIADMVTDAAGVGGTAGPIVMSCGGLQFPILETVSPEIGLAGNALHTITVAGQNLGSITGFKLRKTRDGGAEIPAIGGSFVPGTNSIQATFDLTNAEGGRYNVVPEGGCSMGNTLFEVVLVYMPDLTNAGFEEGYTTDPTTGSVCENPGANGQRPKPKHWDLNKVETDQQSFKRDGNIWMPCVDNPNPPPASIVGGLTGDHYASIQINAGDHPNNFEPENSFFQTFAAPDVVGGEASKDETFYADCAMRSFQGLSSGYIRVKDGTENSAMLIDEVEILNTDLNYGTAGMVSDPSFKVRVPQGYIYQSNPPILTLEFVVHSRNGDQCFPPDCGPNPLGLKGFHVDHVRPTFLDLDCGLIWADVDGDTDVDMEDFAILQRCISEGNPSQPLVSPCDCLDRDINHDLVIDQSDVVEFVKCGTGAGVTWTPEVAPQCVP